MAGWDADPSGQLERLGNYLNNIDAVDENSNETPVVDQVMQLHDDYMKMNRGLTTRNLELHERISKLTRIGGQMANVCFNLGQQHAPELRESSRKAMRGLHVEWDAAMSEASRPTTGDSTP